MALESIVGDVTVQAVERVLISGVADILSPSILMEMTAEQISSIAAESEESKDERLRLTRTLEILQAGATTCKRYVRRCTSCRIPLQ